MATIIALNPIKETATLADRVWHAMAISEAIVSMPEISNVLATVAVPQVVPWADAAKSPAKAGSPEEVRRNAEMFAAHCSGMTRAELADAYELSAARVCKIIDKERRKAEGLDGPQSMLARRNTEIFRRFKDGECRALIARSYGLKLQWVKKIIKC